MNTDGANNYMAKISRDSVRSMLSKARNMRWGRRFAPAVVWRIAALAEICLGSFATMECRCSRSDHDMSQVSSCVSQHDPATQEQTKRDTSVNDQCHGTVMVSVEKLFAMFAWQLIPVNEAHQPNRNPMKHTRGYATAQ